VAAIGINVLEVEEPGRLTNVSPHGFLIDFFLVLVVVVVVVVVV